MYAEDESHDDAAAENQEEELNTPTENRRRKYFVIGILGASVVIFVVLVSLIAAFTLGGGAQTSPGHKHPHTRNVAKGRSWQQKRPGDKKNPKSGWVGGCEDDPPMAEGLQRMWKTGLRSHGSVVNYKCIGNATGTEEVHMKAICLNGEWQATVVAGSVCAAVECTDDPPADDADVFVDWDNVTRLVGTRISYKCSSDPSSAIAYTVVCTPNGTWATLETPAGNCSCGWPVVTLPYRLYFLWNDWEGVAAIGDRLNYTCPRNDSGAGKTFFSLECQPDLTWKVIKSRPCHFLVDKAVNITRARDHCRRRGANLLVLTSAKEQKSLGRMLSGNKVFSKKCHHRAFLGLRENLLQQWRNPDDGKVLSAFSDMWGWLGGDGDAVCSFLSHENYRLLSSSCRKLSLCRLCQFDNVTANELDSTLSSRCRGEPSCILPFAEITEYSEALIKCRYLGGRLASIVGLPTLEKIKAAVETDPHMAHCQGFFVGLKGNNRTYESVEDGSETPFLMFGDSRARHLNKHCVVIHEFQRFRWADESCTHPTCFLCKAQGAPVNSTIESTEASPFVKEGLAKPSDEDEEDEVSMADNDCLSGWVSKGHHCFFYNKTLATNEEAVRACAAHKSILASLANAYERNFILDHLMAFYARTTPTWHIHSPAGLPFRQLESTDVPTDESGQCVFLHLQPELSWSFASCNRKAAFVCHNR